MVQKAVQYVYIAKCLSFMVSTEEGDYQETTEAGGEKQESEGKDDERNYLQLSKQQNEVTVCL